MYDKAKFLYVTGDLRVDRSSMWVWVWDSQGRYRKMKSWGEVDFHATVVSIDEIYWGTHFFMKEHCSQSIE